MARRFKEVRKRNPLAVAGAAFGRLLVVRWVGTAAIAFIGELGVGKNEQLSAVLKGIDTFAKTKAGDLLLNTVFGLPVTAAAVLVWFIWQCFHSTALNDLRIWLTDVGKIIGSEPVMHTERRNYLRIIQNGREYTRDLDTMSDVPITVNGEKDGAHMATVQYDPDSETVQITQPSERPYLLKANRTVVIGEDVTGTPAAITYIPYTVKLQKLA